jgi:hypothetical protein
MFSYTGDHKGRPTGELRNKSCPTVGAGFATTPVRDAYVVKTMPALTGVNLKLLTDLEVF